MPKERILITVKTYPTLSRKYGETVCTAGIREDGSWVRLYPVPFRRLGDKEQYKKFDWIECQIRKNTSDPRPESFRPLFTEELVSVGHMDTSDNWRDRRRQVLKIGTVYQELATLIDAAKANTLSLATFKPKRILDFTWEEEDREWNPEKLHQMKGNYSQLELFEDNAWRETFKIIPKLPYSFSYRFIDASGRPSELQILDWEIGALYWNCIRQCNGDETAAIQKVRSKYLDEFSKKDLHFFLGTTLQFHFVAPNPWVIIGVFPIPHEKQQELFPS
ncbi:MAG: hypothetical protein QUT30_14075 [Acidobacteriota bacterium]|nr:hypothetical protein [Acidobacteriota bacterium]